MITEDQAKARIGKIGSSDAPDLFGFGYGSASPQQQLRNLYFRIMGQQRKTPTALMMEGVYMEEGIISWGEWKIGEKVERHVMLGSKAYPFMAANFDGICVKYADDQPVCSFIVEAKWCRDPRTDGDWGRAGTVVRKAQTGIVPDRVLIQVHHQMIVAGDSCRLAYVAAARPSNGLGLYPVERCDDLCKVIVDRERDFYERYIVPRIAPEGDGQQEQPETEAA